MASEQITIDAAAHEMKAMADDMRKPVTPLLKICSVLVSADAKTNFDLGQTPDGQSWKGLAFPRARGGDKPLRDRGLLMASMTGKGSGAVVRIHGATLEQGTNLEYAEIHQKGGVVTPKKGKYLAIPMTKEAARVGSPRRFPRKLRPIIGKKGGVLVEASKGKRNGKVQYILTKRVSIPARQFLGAGKRLADKLETAVADYFMPGGK